MRPERAENCMWQQTLITLRARPRGFHLVTDELIHGLPELRECRVGLLHLWLQHTSASLTINENADPAVRRDFDSCQSWSITNLLFASHEVEHERR